MACGRMDVKHWFKVKTGCSVEAWVAARDADEEAGAEAFSRD